jgi:hypothetical protein
MRTIIAFYEALAAAVVGHIAIVLAIIGVAVLIVAAYHYGRHTQHGADRAALAESYKHGLDDGLDVRAAEGRRVKLDNAQVRGGVGGVEVRGIIPTGIDLGGPGDWPYTLAPGSFARILGESDPTGVTPWRDVPAKLKADDAVREWRAERGLVAD